MLRADLRHMPRVTMMGQVAQPVGWQNRLARLDVHMLILVLGGDMVFDVGENRHVLGSGGWLLMLPGEGYRANSRQGCQYTFIHFLMEEPMRRVQAADEGEWIGPGGFPYMLPVSEREHVLYLPESGRLTGGQEKIRAMLTECDVLRCGMNASRKLRVDLHLAEILSLLDVCSGQTGAGGYPPVLSRMLHHIHEHYAETLTLSDLSDTFQLSRQYIMRLFGKHLHTTVTRYITRLKMTHALELLRYSTFRVGAVAEMLGYSNAYYFCRVFRQHFGMTPTEYIRDSLGNGQAQALPLDTARPADDGRNGAGHQGHDG